MTASGFELVTGVTTVVFGPNGAGKTTLLRELVAESGAAAYLPQQPYLFRGLAGTNLGLGLTDEECGLAGQYARRFGLGELLSQPARVASGGERARLGLARTLATSDDIVLLDEPLAAVDLVERPAIAATIRQALRGRTAVIVTHELEQVVTLGDRLAIMIDGHVVQQGTVETVMAHPRSEAVARTIGVTNVYDGDVVSTDASTVTVQTDSVRLIGTGDVETGAPVRVLIPAETVTLLESGSTPSGGSARNRWSGVIRDMEPVGRLTEVVVDVGVPLRAIVTPGSVDELGLAVGGIVVAAVKASSVRVVAQ
ncbi:MAG: ATP-binding cassette domain-containing protein [Acidimicrobiia bacterium]|nr:ATP-binding cassette domain-containing protein [Acidimicrobiia bacterium]